MYIKLHVHVYTCIHVYVGSICKLKATLKESEKLSCLACMHTVMHTVVVRCRQQIEDVEREVSRLKDLVKKKEDNEKKYQGACCSYFTHR